MFKMNQAALRAAHQVYPVRNNCRLQDLIEILILIPSSLSLAIQEDLSDVMSSPAPDKQLSLTGGFAIPPFAFSGSFTSTQNDENTAGPEHHYNNCCEIYDESVTQSVSCMFLHRTESQVAGRAQLLASPASRWDVRRSSASSR